MKNTLISFCVYLSLSFYSSVIFAEKSLVDEYMEITGINETIDMYPIAYTAEAKNQFKTISAGFWESPKYKSLISIYYNEIYLGWKIAIKESTTEDELEKIIKFLKTPLGKRIQIIQKTTRPKYMHVNSIAVRRLNDKLNKLIYSHENR